MAASPDGIDLAAGETSHDRSCSLLPIAHPLALSRAWRGRLRRASRPASPDFDRTSAGH